MLIGAIRSERTWCTVEPLLSSPVSRRVSALAGTCTRTRRRTLLYLRQTLLVISNFLKIFVFQIFHFFLFSFFRCSPLSRVVVYDLMSARSYTELK